MAERQIGHRKSCLVLSGRFPVLWPNKPNQEEIAMMCFGPSVRQRKVNPKITIGRAGTVQADYLFQKEVPVSGNIRLTSTAESVTTVVSNANAGELQHPWPCWTWRYRVRWTKRIWVKQWRGNAWTKSSRRLNWQPRNWVETLTFWWAWHRGLAAQRGLTEYAFNILIGPTV